MQKNLADYSVYYKKEDLRITDILDIAYVEINDGYGFNNEVKYVINIKILFIDPNGLLRCLEDDADQFIFFDDSGIQKPIKNEVIETVTIS